MGGLPGNWGSGKVPAESGVQGGAGETPEDEGHQEIIIDVGNPATNSEGYQQIFIRHQESGVLEPVYCTAEEVRELLQNCPEDSSAEGNTHKPTTAVPTAGEAHQSGKGVVMTSPTTVVASQPSIVTSPSNKLIKIDIQKPVDRKRPITATVVTNKKSQYQIMKVQPEPPVKSAPQINSPAPKIAPIEETKSPGQMFVDEEFPAEIPQQFADQTLDLAPFPSFGVQEDLAKPQVPQIFDPQMGNSPFKFGDELQAGEIPECEQLGESFDINEFLTMSPKSSAPSSSDASSDLLGDSPDLFLLGEELDLGGVEDEIFNLGDDLFQGAAHLLNDPILG